MVTSVFMRGRVKEQTSMWMLASPDERIPQDHPIRRINDCRGFGVSAHVAQHTNRRRSAVDQRTTRHAGYAVSQRIRRRIESIFGWMKTTGGFARTRVRGIARTQLVAQFVGAAYNLLRLARALPEAA